MQLIKDYKFRKLVAEYLHWIFTTGYDRVIAHRDVCKYLIENWDLYDEIKNSPAELDSQENNLRLLMAEFITNDVFDSLDYPTNSNGHAIFENRHTKTLVDNFCKALEKLKPILKKDLDFWLDKEGGEHVRITGRYQKMDKYLIDAKV